jgi:hypothetical protein
MKIEWMNKIVNFFRGDEEKSVRIYKGRALTRDIAFQFRMGAGFAGDVNRTHPSGIEPALGDPANFPTGYGQAVMVGASNGVRNPVAGDQAGAVSIFGVVVRPFPVQQTVGGISAAFASEVPQLNQPLDILKSGYVIVKLFGAAAAVKGSPVFVWAAASGGGHVQGGFEAVATGGSTFPLDATGNRIYFNGPADANGLVELVFNP